MAEVTECDIKDTETTFEPNNGQRIRRDYLITMDDKSNEDEVYNKAIQVTVTPRPLPSIYSYLSGTAYVLSVDIRQYQPDNYVKWLATVNGGPLPDGQDPGNEGQDPPDWTPIIWMESYTETREIEQAYKVTNDPSPGDEQFTDILNTAGDAFDDRVQDEFDIYLISIQRNYWLFGDMLKLNLDYSRSRNSDVITFPITPTGNITAEANTLQYLRTTASAPIRWDNTGQYYYRALTRLAYKPETWVRGIAQRGYRVLIDVGEGVFEKTDAKDLKTQQPVTEPVLLAANGTRLPDNDPVVYEDYYLLEAKPFAPFFS